MSDIANELRDSVSGPHERGRKYTVPGNMDGLILCRGAYEIERLRREIARLKDEIEGYHQDAAGASI